MSKVYFARCGDYVKIGFSSRPEVRAKTLLRGNLLVPADLDRAQPVELIRVLHDCIVKDERTLHEQFAEFRVEGEWFRASPEFLSRVSGLNYTPIRELRRRARRENRPRKWGKPHDHNYYMRRAA